jgi:transposase-like protein
MLPEADNIARRRVHWMRNALAYVPKTQQSMVAAALRQAFLQPDRAQASIMLTLRRSNERSGDRSGGRARGSMGSR